MKNVSRREVADICEDRLGRFLLRLLHEHAVPVLCVGITQPPGEVGNVVVCSDEGTTDEEVRRLLRQVLALLDGPPKVRLDGATEYRARPEGPADATQ